MAWILRSTARSPFCSAPNPGHTTLGGTLTVTVHDGIGVFDGLTLNAVDSGYTLQIASKFPTITTDSFNVISNPTPWQGTFYPVPTDASLRNAVNLADTNTYAYNTILLAASNYLLSDASSGGILITNGTSLPSKTLTIAGQGQANTIVASVYNWHDRIFEIEGSTGSALNVVLQDLAIEGGNAQGGGVLGGTAALGGGLLIDDADVTLASVLLQSNQAHGGPRIGRGGRATKQPGKIGDGQDANGGPSIWRVALSPCSTTPSVRTTPVEDREGEGGEGGGQGDKVSSGRHARPRRSGGDGGTAATAWCLRGNRYGSARQRRSAPTRRS